MSSKRVQMIFPLAIVEVVNQYKERNHLQNFTAAVLELIRKGLEFEAKERQQK
jgi:hypothetical protein